MKLPPPYHLWRAVLVGVCCFGPASWAATPPTIRFMVKQFSIEGAAPLADKAIQAYFLPLQKRQYTLKELQGVSKGLETLLHDGGYPFYRVILPPQTLTAGEVKFLVKPILLGDVGVQGNQYFSTGNIIASVPGLHKGEPLDTNDVSQALRVANKHPSKQLQVTFKSSNKAEQVDANIKVKEQHPYQATLSMNTVGTKSTGNFRMIGAVQHSNVWGLDHIFNASYTTSPDHADTVKQYGGSYSLPLYALKGWLSAYYAYSNVNAGTIANDLTVTGSGEMYGLHYQQFLPKWGNYEQWLDIGLDNRAVISDIR
ncbi:MAG: POTRA domain-containing protein, partial [Methylovulum sp.]|nr:POTRA domain-containing protein [Methylovulum sp.]